MIFSCHVTEECYSLIKEFKKARVLNLCGALHLEINSLSNEFNKVQMLV